MTRCKDIVRKVPRALIQDGIDKCKSNIDDYLKDAALISKNDKLYHALISLEFGLEEFGKLLLIKKTRDNSLSDPLEIDNNIFCDHDAKVKMALDILDPAEKYRTLFQIWAPIWKKGMWETTELSSATRLDCAFVDFKNGCWTIGRKVDPKLFENFLTHFKEGLKKV